ncbi:FAS1 domain-containing protein [Phlyctochytrium arcticum]|nr:FAS1 domain-containing protein [Phlyctochytrium arcticum]
MKSILNFLAFTGLVLSGVHASPMSATIQITDDGPQTFTSFRNEGLNKNEGTIVDRLRGDKRFTRFVEVLQKERGLKDDLEDRHKTMTLFAPTNEAIKHMEEHMPDLTSSDSAMRDALRYHIIPDMDMHREHMHKGLLLKTSLKLKTLRDRPQVIRVGHIRGDFWLNMRARVEEHDTKAENGRIFAIDRVLMPPINALDMLYALPTMFSTYLAAAERSGMTERMVNEKEMTMFVPSNNAWKRLGVENLMYLFSCPQHCKCHSNKNKGSSGCNGRRDLKRIMEYSMAKELGYTCDMMGKKEMCMKTFLEGEKMCVEARQRGHGRGRTRHGDKHDVRNWMFLMNEGEASIAFTDFPAENAVMHLVDNVLVPNDVKLPTSVPEEFGEDYTGFENYI